MAFVSGICTSLVQLLWSIGFFISEKRNWTTVDSVDLFSAQVITKLCFVIRQKLEDSRKLFVNVFGLLKKELKVMKTSWTCEQETFYKLMLSKNRSTTGSTVDAVVLTNYGPSNSLVRNEKSEKLEHSPRIACQVMHYCEKAPSSYTIPLCCSRIRTSWTDIVARLENKSYFKTQK